MSETGTFTERAKVHGMTAPQYAVHLVEKHGGIESAARAAMCNRNTIKYHLKAIGAIVRTVTLVEIPEEVSA